MKALVLGAHLDDSVIALGGILRKIVNAGGRVDVVCFGNSDEDFADVADQETAPERITAQARQAHEILGVSTFTCFNYPDYDVRESRETYRLCIQSIRKCEPDIVFAHYWAEYFQHRAMARMGCDSWWQAGWSCGVIGNDPVCSITPGSRPNRKVPETGGRRDPTVRITDDPARTASAALPRIMR